MEAAPPPITTDTQQPPPPFPTDAKRSRDRATIILSFVVVTGFFIYVTLVTFHSATVDKDILFLVLGNLSAQFTQVVSFFFGSSASSATKDEKVLASPNAVREDQPK